MAIDSGLCVEVLLVMSVFEAGTSRTINESTAKHSRIH
jgi:hypothetical protein